MPRDFGPRGSPRCGPTSPALVVAPVTAAPRSPAWHRNLSARRSRARRALRKAKARQAVCPNRVNRAIESLCVHHGSTLSFMGKWAKCRNCGWYTPKLNGGKQLPPKCTGCGEVFAQPTNPQQQPIGAAAQPVTPPNAAQPTGAAAPQRAASRWRQPRHRKEIVPVQPQPQPMDGVTKEAAEQRKQKSSEIARLQAIISSIAGRQSTCQ